MLGPLSLRGGEIASASGFRPEAAIPPSTISGHVSTTVTLGSGGYGDTLTLTVAAYLAPNAAGADGIVVPATLSGVDITNDGRIVAGSGDGAVASGIGVDMLGAGTLVNHGVIEGGYSGTLDMPLGGAGVVLDRGATLINDGTITGGNANYGGFAATGIYISGGLAGAGVYVDGGSAINNAVIDGGAGESGGSSGGAGVRLAAGGSLINNGTITGGAAGELGGTTGPGANAGDGVDILSTATLTNNGTIIGGYGGTYNFGTEPVGTPGAGVFIAAGGLVTNYRLIEGGTSGFGCISAGGAGVEMEAGGTLINRGTITGGTGSSPETYVTGSGYSPGGDGVDVVLFGTISNGGTITGGAGGQEQGYFAIGGDGVYLHAGTLTNGGLIQGGGGGVLAYFDPSFDPFGNAGGIGVDLASDGAITNNGTILGGAGSPSLTQGFEGGPDGGTGGIGVEVGQGGTLINRGRIVGGAGGNALGYHAYAAGDGGMGVFISSLANLFVNHGTIIGGAAGLEQNPQSSAVGVGGIGADVDIAGAASNSGAISGGTGGAAVNVYGPPAGTGGAGGAGVSFGGGTFTNTGVITGGTGGYGLLQGGAGGAGVYLDGATLVNAGTIAGGAGGFGNLSDGATGDAVLFAPTAHSGSESTLVIEPGAVFDGLVVASAAANDVLELGGKAPGTIGDLGIDFINFSSIIEEAGSDWSITRLNELGTSTTLQVEALLSVTVTLVADGPVDVGRHGDLVVAAGGGIGIGTNLVLTGGTVSGLGAFSVGAGPGVGPGGTISGFGTLAVGGSYNGGTVIATGGTLSLQGPYATSYIESLGTTFLIDSGAALQIDSSGLLSNVVLAPGGQATLIVGNALTPSIDVTLTGFGSGDIIDLKDLVASSADFSGGTLAVPNGPYPYTDDILFFTGGITAANLKFISDRHGGTDVSFVPTSHV
jgi:autotransporter family porin